MRLSYAQRLEDTHLDQIFAGQSTGFYIDIGGGHPVADNVSFWFYLKGWRGLVVEPQRALADLYAHVRPRDTTVCALVGQTDGEAQFHIVDRFHGLSTTIEAHARVAAEYGAGFTTERRPVHRLASLAKTHGVGTVDFLKIDVEGAEADVLAGGDWAQCRPRVILIEAIAPVSMAESWGAWEPALLANGYRFVLFDGLNRFYVAEEAHAALKDRFPAEPKPWDSVGHLYDCGHADVRADHPDHALARRLVDGFLAALPALDPALVRRLLARPGPLPEGAELARLLLGSAEYPGPAVDGSGSDAEDHLRRLMDSDRFRAALGRIASTYDGGHIME